MLELLPWYVNESLEGRELATVLKHLSSCEICQAQRDHLYGLQRLIQDDAGVASDTSLSFRRVMRRIESSEKNHASLRDVEHYSIKGRRGWLAGSLVAALVLAVGLISNTPDLTGQAEFQTLSSDLISTGKDARRMQLGFAQPIPATALRRALIETRSTIISGPDDQGRYLVEVTVPGDENAEEFLRDIKQIDGVEFARFAQR